MNVEWDPKIGPAAIISFGGAIAVLVTIGTAWGTLQAKIDHVIAANNTADQSLLTLQKHNNKQDEKIASQSAQISGIQSTVNFIVPSLQRIEQRLEAALANKDHTRQ